MSPRGCRRRFVIVSLLAAGPLAAQNAPADAPLAGPKVEQNRPALLDQSLSSTMAAPQGDAAARLPLTEIRALLERLMPPAQTDPQLVMSAQQREQLTAIEAEFRATSRAFQAEHGPEIRRLRSSAGRDLPEEKRIEAHLAAHDTLRLLEAQRPSSADLQTQAFAVLRPEQRAWIDQQIAQLLESRAQERGLSRYRQQLAKASVTEQSLFRADGTVKMDALPQKLRDRLAQIPEPARSQRLRAMFKEALQPKAERPNSGRPNTGQPHSGQPDVTTPAPPSMDELTLPSLDGEPGPR